MTSAPPLGRLRALASRHGGEVQGSNPLLRQVQSLEEAETGDLTLLVSPSFRALARETRASAVLCTPALSGALLPSGTARWVHPEPWRVLSHLLRAPEPHQPGRTARVVHRSAQVDRSAVLAPGVVVERGARIGARAVIGPNAVVCADADVGEDTVVGACAVIGPKTRLGRRVRVGPGAVVGSDGFGYVATARGLVPIPHAGRVVVEDDVDLGANACIARATLGTTRIAAGARIDNLVQVGHNVAIGPGSILAAQVGLAGSVQLGAGVVVGGQAGVADHVQVGDGARLAAKAGVIGDVPAGETFAGYPARPRARWLREHAALSQLVRKSSRGARKTKGRQTS